MSHVSDVIVMWSVSADERETLPAINGFFEVESGLVGMDEPSNYGGSKALQANVAVGAFRSLNIPAFLAHLRVVCERPELTVGWLQVAIQDENHDGFRLVELWREGWTAPPGWHDG